MPPRHHQDHPPARLEPGQQICAIPFPRVFPTHRGVCLGPGLHGVVDNGEVGSSSGNRPTNARSEIFAAVVGAPATGGTLIIGKPVIEHGAVVLHQGTCASAEVTCEAVSVAGHDECGPRMTAEVPGREQNRDIGRLGGARRHQHHQPVGLAAADGVERGEQPAMMQRRCLSDMIEDEF